MGRARRFRRFRLPTSTRRIERCSPPVWAPRMPPTEMAPGIFMIFLRDPDGRTIELAQFADGATCSAEYTRAQG